VRESEVYALAFRAQNQGDAWVNNGGRDAPLSPRGRTIFRTIMLGLLIVFIVLLVWSVR
jgi:hypothetical protein